VWPFNVYLAVHQSPFDITEVVSGGARGVDTYGTDWALERNIPIKLFRPDWDKFGKGAGFIRNTQMAEYADALVAVWDGQSKGTAHMIKTMEALGKPVYVYKTSEQ
jgi:hypothetical protein